MKCDLFFRSIRMNWNVLVRVKCAMNMFRFRNWIALQTQANIKLFHLKSGCVWYILPETFSQKTPSEVIIMSSELYSPTKNMPSRKNVLLLPPSSACNVSKDKKKHILPRPKKNQSLIRIMREYFFLWAVWPCVSYGLITVRFKTELSTFQNIKSNSKKSPYQIIIHFHWIYFLLCAA